MLWHSMAWQRVQLLQPSYYRTANIGLCYISPSSGLASSAASSTRSFISMSVHTTSSVASSAKQGPTGAGGRGRGRGRGQAPYHTAAKSQSQPRLTHCKLHPHILQHQSNTAQSYPYPLSVPNHYPRPAYHELTAILQGHHSTLRTRLSTFTDALQQSEPPITGLDPSIVIDPRRVHLTLGVMSLFSSTPDPDPTKTNGYKTLAAALALLQTLAPQIHSILDGNTLKFPLHEMGILKPERGRDKGKANVLWLGPGPGAQENERLEKVCKLINETFINEGLLADEKRPLKVCFRSRWYFDLQH